MAEKPKTLTLKLDFETYAEFSAATAILRGRNMSAILYLFVQSKIREARETVSPEEFARIVADHKADIIRNSETKARERKGVPHAVIHLTETNKRTKKIK